MMPAPEKLTLDRCIEIALSSNPTIKISGLEIERVNYAKKEVLANLLPTANFGVNYNRTLAKQVAYMNLGAMSGLMGGGSKPGEGSDSDDESTSNSDNKKADSGFKMGLDNSWSTGFNASMPLVAPQLWQSLKLSDSQIVVANEQARNSKLEMVNAVKCAYYAFLMANDSRRVIQESYEMAKLTYDTYSKQYALGAASEYDVLRTSVAMKNIEPEITQAEIAVKQARLQLLTLMGLQADTPFEIEGSIESEREFAMSSPEARTVKDLANNPSLRVSRAGIDLAYKNIKFEKASFLPTLALSASYNWTSSSNGNPFRNFRWNPYSMVGLTLNVPLIQGGARISRVRQAQNSYQQSLLQYDNLERQLNMQLDLAIDNIRLNVKQIGSCDESERQAGKAYDIMKRSFAIGAASYLDMRDAELALTRSRLASLQAVYNTLVAKSGLELLEGSYNLRK